MAARRRAAAAAGVTAPAHAAHCAGGVTARLAYRPPYQWAAMLDFLEARAVPATEPVADGGYRRSLRIVGDGGAAAAGIVEVRHLPARGALSVAMAPALQPHAPQVLARIAHLFDVGSDPAAVAPVL